MTLREIEARALRFAPALLAASVLGHFTMVLFQAKMTMVDLLVYRDGSAQLFGGHLYDWRLSQFSDVWALPFTYPPFAALVFFPLSFLPWALVRWLWQIISVACLWWLVRVALRLVAERSEQPADAALWRRRAMLWTALCIWCEPVRTTFNYGQINLLLDAVLLAGMACRRSTVSGFAVGLTAGVKLTPAVSGLYYLVTKRWAAAAWSVVAGALTLAVTYLLVPEEFTRYWFHLLFDPTRIGPIGSAINQSLRAALSRTVGYDVGIGPIWLGGVLVAAVLTGWALRSAIRAGDRLGGILAVEFFTLLVSPISWSHHWVWVVPALLWLIYGRARGRLVTVTAVLWLAAVGSFLISFLLKWQGPDIWPIPHPWWQSL
ncbi:MAG: mannosyltransferase, partial [Sciscionella sp.]